MKYFKSLSVVFFLSLFAISCASVLEAADYRVGDLWRTEGGGFVEKGIVRVSMDDKGWLRIISDYDEDSGIETVTGYEVWAELEASKLGINAWEYKNQITLGIPIPIKDFNPSMSEPFKLPAITFDDLTFTLELTSVHSGTLKMRGYVDIDGVGRCEVNADNAMWRDGTPKPSIPDTSSGCNAAGWGILLPFMALLVFPIRTSLKR